MQTQVNQTNGTNGYHPAIMKGATEMSMENLNDSITPVELVTQNEQDPHIAWFREWEEQYRISDELNTKAAELGEKYLEMHCHGYEVRCLSKGGKVVRVCTLEELIAVLDGYINQTKASIEAERICCMPEGHDLRKWKEKEIRAFFAWRDGIERFEKETGYRAAVNGCDTAMQRRYELVNMILETPVTTIEGLICQARIFLSASSCAYRVINGEKEYAEWVPLQQLRNTFEEMIARVG